MSKFHPRELQELQERENERLQEQQTREVERLQKLQRAIDEREEYYRNVRSRAYGVSQAQRPSMHSIFSPSTLAAPAKSRVGFLDLPAELRNQIYRYALVVPDLINGIMTKIPAIRQV